MYKRQVYFLSSSNETITSAGNEFRGYIYFKGTGTYTLQDDLNGRTNYGIYFYHNSGTINTNNKDITINGSYDFYGGTNNTSRTLNLGSSTISGNVFYIYGGGLTLNSGTSVLNCTGVSSGFNIYNYGNSLSFHTINFTASSGVSTLYGQGFNDISNLSFSSGGNISGQNTIGTLNLSSNATYELESGNTQTINNNINFGGACFQPVTIKSSSTGSQATITKSSGVINGQNLNIKDMNANGGATFNAYVSTHR